LRGIRKYFDTLDHACLREILDKRVRDGVVRRLIGKWLNAGVLDQGCMTRPVTGTPQGGVISPLLANIYLHEVLDVWFSEKVKLRLRGRAFLVCCADDFIMGFAHDWAKSLKGGWVVKQKTSRKRLGRAVEAMGDGIRENRHKLPKGADQLGKDGNHAGAVPAPRGHRQAVKAPRRRSEPVIRGAECLDWACSDLRGTWGGNDPGLPDP